MTHKRVRGILQVVISAVLMLIVLRQVGWEDVRGVLAGMNPAWLAAAWALYVLGFVVRAVRWRVLLRALGIHRPLRELTLWYLVGGFFNVILPTGFGGDVVRVVELGQDTARTGAVLNSVVVDRYLGLMALLAMGLVAGLLRPDLAAGPILWLIALLLAGGLAATWLLTRPWWRRWAAGEGRLSRLIRVSRLPGVADGLTQYGWGVMARAIGVSVGFNLLQIGWNIAIAISLGLYLPVALYFVFVPLTSVALLLPAFGGLGVRELTYVTLLGGAGVPPAEALALSLGVYAITVATGLLGGALYLVQGVRRAAVRRALSRTTITHDVQGKA